MFRALRSGLRHVYAPTTYLVLVAVLIAAPWGPLNTLRATYEPFVILTTFWVNALLFSYWKQCEQKMYGTLETDAATARKQDIIQVKITAWQSVVLGVFGILFNGAYEKLFSNYLITNQSLNIPLSLAYAVLQSAAVFGKASHRVWVTLHCAALYAPLAREFWPVNVALYTVLLIGLTCSAIANMQFEDTLLRKIPSRPVMESFVYLRVHWQVGVLIAVIHIIAEEYFRRFRQGQSMMTLEEQLELHRKIDQHLQRKKNSTVQITGKLREHKKLKHQDLRQQQTPKLRVQYDTN